MTGFVPTRITCENPLFSKTSKITSCLVMFRKRPTFTPKSHKIVYFFTKNVPKSSQFLLSRHKKMARFSIQNFSHRHVLIHITLPQKRVITRSSLLDAPYRCFWPTGDAVPALLVNRGPCRVLYWCCWSTWNLYWRL